MDLASENRHMTDFLYGLSGTFAFDILKNHWNLVLKIVAAT